MAAIGRRKSPAGRKPSNPEHPFARWIGTRSRNDVARLLGISRSRVDRLASGAVVPSLELAIAIEDLTRGAVPCRVWVRPVLRS